MLRTHCFWFRVLLIANRFGSEYQNQWFLVQNYIKNQWFLIEFWFRIMLRTKFLVKSEEPMVLVHCYAKNEECGSELS